jgi:acyl-CoA dehydrogenase
VVFNLTFLRRRYITPHLLSYFHKNLPPISATEREVLEAGGVWWEQELFCGRPDWQQLPQMPAPKLNETEQAFLSQQVETLCAMLDDWELVQKQELSPEIWDYLKQQGFLGISISKEFGGLGFSVAAQSQIVTKIATRSTSAAITVMVPNSLGTGEFLQHYGTATQKHYYLPRLARGEEIPAFALTGPEAGSDASGITDTGVVCQGHYHGKEVIGIRLNWNKRYITLAPIATILGLAFKLHDPEHLLGDQESIGITLCLVPTRLPGVKMGLRHKPAGLAFLNGPTRGQDVFVPLDFIIGGVEMRGKGWRMLMEALAGGRGISLPALSAGIAQLCYRTTGAYARIRRQFNMSIGQFEGVTESLGRIAGLTYLCEAARYFTLVGIHAGIKPALAAAITKYHLTEMSRSIVNDALDVHAGRGIQAGPRNYLWQLYQTVPICITVEGANLLTRNLMIFGQGAIRCHPYIKNEIASLAEPDPKKRLADFDKLLGGHLGFALSTFIRSFSYGLTGGLLIKTPAMDPRLRQYCRQLTRMSTSLAFSADIVMFLLGGTLKRRERLSARLGDVLSQLYLASAVIKYYYDHEKPAADWPFLQWTLEKCLYDMQTAFISLFNNLKPRWIARILQWVIFPWGKMYRLPGDHIDKQLADAMMHHSPQRERLTECCYIGTAKSDAVELVESALAIIESSAAALEKMQQALAQDHAAHGLSLQEKISLAAQRGILSADEVKLLGDMATQQWNAIQVDEFE